MFLEDLVREIAIGKQRELIKFCYFLLKKDIQKKHVEQLLNGGQIRPNVLYEAVMANKWNPELNKMEPIENVYFQVVN